MHKQASIKASRAGMARLIATLFVACCLPTWAQSKHPVASIAQATSAPIQPAEPVIEIYKTISVDDHHQLHIVTADGHIITPRMGKDQIGFQSPALSPDKRTAGWLALYSVPGVTSALPLDLVIYKNGETLHRFKGNHLPIWNWKFLDDGRQVAYGRDTLHFSDGGHYELRNVESGRLVSSYNGDPRPDASQWVHAVAMNVPHAGLSRPGATAVPAGQPIPFAPANGMAIPRKIGR